MKLRFQADADLNQVILQAVIRQIPEIDFQTATAAGLEGIDDPAVLALATRENRVLVSHDKKTMPYHFANFIKDYKSAGVILLPQSLSVARAAEDLILIWAASDSQEWENRIGYLPL